MLPCDWVIEIDFKQLMLIAMVAIDWPARSKVKKLLRAIQQIALMITYTPLTRVDLKM